MSLESEYWNVIVYLRSVSLCNALGNPHNVATLLLLQAHKRVEHTKVELLHEGLHINLHLQMVCQHAKMVYNSGDGCLLPLSQRTCLPASFLQGWYLPQQRWLHTPAHKSSIYLFRGSEQPRPITTHRVNVSHSFDLVIVLTLGQPCQSLRIQTATCGVQLLTVIHGQLCPKRVDGDNECTPVCLKLSERNKSTERNVSAQQEREHHTPAVSFP